MILDRFHKSCQVKGHSSHTTGSIRDFFYLCQLITFEKDDRVSPYELYDL